MWKYFVVNLKLKMYIMKLCNWIWFVLVLMVQFCILFLYLLYIKDIIVFENFFLGIWIDNEDIYVFEKWKDNGYLFIYMDGLD